MANPTENKLTIDEIAKLCGVSKASISRYLNGKFSNLSPATRERIKAVIDETHYRPNRSAQRLKASRSMLIGCVIGDVSSPFSAILLHGITKACDKAGYQVLFADCEDDPVKERAAIEGFLENRVDGLIVNTSGGNDDFLLEVQSKGIPIVLADRGLMSEGKLDYVSAANRKMAKRCVEYLKECGYEKVALFSERIENISTRLRRCEGYLDGLREYYSDDTTPLIFEYERRSEESCTEKLREFIDKNRGRRLAILTVNGVSCQHVLIAGQTLGIQFGHDFGLCSFDDWSWLQLAPPGITTVKIGTEFMGEEAARLLLQRISGERDYDAPGVSVEAPCELIIRGSTKK